MVQRISSAVLALVFAAATAAHAQITADGSIRGYVRDEQQAVLPGVTVTAVGTNVAGTYTATTDSNGFFRLLNVPPGTYTVTAELQGFSRSVRPDVVVRAGLNLTLDMTMRVGALEEAVEVRAETPILETTKPTQGVNISGDFQRSLPLGSRRDWSDFLEAAPGVTSRTINNPQGGQMYLLRGGEIDGHVFQVDGADLGSFRQSLPSYLGMSTETIADAQVKTGGIDASAPLGTGVVVNIATQSGTNLVKGSGAMAITPRSWNGDNTPNGTSAINEIFQAEGGLGGPIVRDRAWFYGTYRYSDRTTGIFRDAITLNTMRGIVPGYEPFDNESTFHYYFAKGTTQLNSRHQLLGFYQRDINPEESASANFAERFSATAFGGSGYNLRLSSVWTNALTSRFSISYNDKSFNRDIDIVQDHLGTGPQLNVHRSVTPVQGALSGSGTLAVLQNVSAVVRSPTTKATFQGDVTFYRSGLLGSHEFQTGFFLQPKLSWVNENFYANGGFAQEDAVLLDPNNLSGGYQPFRRFIFDVDHAVTTDLDAEDYGFYIQDTWSPMKRLTLNLGLRADLVKVTDNIANVVMQDSWNVGPRLGATYALTEGNDILRASWARIHEQPYAFSIPSGATEVIGVRTLYDVDLDGTFETEFYDPPTTFIATNQVLDPEKHMQFADEWILGYRRSFRGQTTFDVSFVRRNWKDRPASLEINAIYDGNVFVGYRDENFNQFFRITNNEWNWLVYSGLEFTVSKRSRNLQLLGGYTRTWDSIEGTWQPRDPASFIQPDAFPNNRGIGSFRGGASDGNSYTNQWNTRNSAWQKHQLRLSAAYQAPWNILLATNYTLLSGPYVGPIIDRVAASDPQFGPPTVTLSNGRVVQNPLATRERFVYPTRGEGQIKLPALHVWNIRIGRAFRFGGTRIEPSIDVFNVANNDSFQEFFIGQSNLRYSPNYIIGPDGAIRGNNRQFARAAQFVTRITF
jgi:hypothetical protein